MIFSKRNDNKLSEDSDKEINENKLIEDAVILKPQICLVDFDDEIVNSTKKRGFNIRTSTLGLPISVPNNKLRDKNFCLLNYDLPSNVHEYDIIAIDMEEKKPISYDVSQNVREHHKSNKSLYFYTEYPQTIFDPRAFSGQILQSQLSDVKNRKYILIVFASQREEHEYTIVSMENDGYRANHSQNIHNYSFLNNVYFEKNIYGKETEVVIDHEAFSNLLNSNNNLFHYEAVFYHPTYWENSKSVKDENFIPLIVNSNKEIVSYFNVTNEALIFIFPQMREKEKILIPLFEEILPSIIPDVFPNSTLFSWKNSEEYWLPNHKSLEDEKERIEHELKEKLNEIDSRIKENINEHSFLHDLITETDDKLVDAIKKYLEWIGFKNVKKMDSENKLKEEDLQVELENGLLIVEIKGLGGTSKDSDCSQISKVKFRRCKERGKFDVLALYIVNHQRYLAPKKRKNPPFTQIQITDAENDERGLLTTWDLFRSYFFIMDGIVKKEDVQKKILNYGLIKITPDNLLLLGKVKEVFKGGLVFILKVDNTCIKVGDNLIISIDDGFQRVKILNLQFNDGNVNEVTSGEVGVLIDKPIKKNSQIYIEIKR